MVPHPKTILFDLDDTLLNTYRHQDAEALWREVIEQHTHALPGVDGPALANAIQQSARRIWHGLLESKIQPWQSMSDIRRDIVCAAFEDVGLDDNAGALRLADTFTQRREDSFHIADGALNTLDHLRSANIRLALVTNGASTSQRWKIEQFNLEPYFDHIQIEEEAGFGKPDPRAYQHALASLDADASNTWMIGDNYTWEVEAPQDHGIFAIWHNPTQLDVPNDAKRQPNHAIEHLNEIVDLFEISRRQDEGQEP